MLSQNDETILPNSTMRLSNTPVSDFLSLGMNHNYCPLIVQSKITKPKNYNKIAPLAIYLTCQLAGQAKIQQQRATILDEDSA
jgi:hypothetical protein